MKLNKDNMGARLATWSVVLFMAFAATSIVNAQYAYAAAQKIGVNIISSCGQKTWGTEQELFLEGTADDPQWVAMVNPQVAHSGVGKPTKDSIKVMGTDATDSTKQKNIPETETITVNGTSKTVTNWVYNVNTGLLTLKRVPDYIEYITAGNPDSGPAGLTIYNTLLNNQVGNGAYIYGVDRNGWTGTSSSINLGGLSAAANGKNTAWILKAESTDETDTGLDKIFNMKFPAVANQSALNSNKNRGYARYKVENLKLYSVYVENNTVKYYSAIDNDVYDYNKKTGMLEFPSDNNYDKIVAVASISEVEGTIKPKLKERTASTITIWRAANQTYWFSDTGADNDWHKITFDDTGKAEADGKTIKLKNGGITVFGLDTATSYYFKTKGPDDTEIEKKIRTLSAAEDDSLTIPLDEGDVIDASGTITSHNDWTGTMFGTYRLQTTFHVSQSGATLDSARSSGGDNQEIVDKKNEFIAETINGKNISMYCTNAGANYTGGTHTVKIQIESINQKTGTVKAYAYMNGYLGSYNPYPGSQGMKGPLNFEALEKSIEIEIVKLPNDEGYVPSNQNEAYSVDGAVFKIHDDSLNKDVETVTLKTKASEPNGKATATVKDLAADHKYSVIEVTSPLGYAFNTATTTHYSGKDKTIYTVHKVDEIEGDGGDTVTVKFADESQYGVPFKITKFDDTTKESLAQGNGSLENVIYKVSYYGTHQKNKKSGVETRTWYLKTLYEDVDGEKTATAKFDEEHLVNNSDYPSKDFYKLSDGTIVCPLGSYYVKEVFIPDNDGYLLSDNTERYFDFDVTAEQGQSTKTSFNMREQAQSSAGSDVDAFDKLTKYYNTVKRGELEIIKADTNFRTYQKPRTDGQAANDGDSQGNATFENAVYAVVNRSRHYVISPLDGATKIQPGGVVCTIKTDKTGYASTTQSLLNGWQKPAAWHGSLAYGDYEVFEIQAPEGYLLGQWNNDAVTYYSMVTASRYISGVSVLVGLTAAQAKSKYGFANSDPWMNTFKPEAALVSISPVGENKTLVKQPSGYVAQPQPWINNDKVMVSFTSHGPDPDPARLRELGILPEHWSEDTVKRGDITVIKSDDSFRSYSDVSETSRTTVNTSVTDDAQGNATLKGAIYSVVNRSVHAIVSPETGAVVQPGQVVCHIVTDINGRATTKESHYKDGAYAENGWTIPSGWHGALPYGDYEVFEIEAPVGYLLGHWNNDAVTYYSMLTKNAGLSVLGGLSAADAKSRFGFKNESNRDTFVAGQTVKSIHPSLTENRRQLTCGQTVSNWISDDKTIVCFTKYKEGQNGVGDIDLRSYATMHMGDEWSEDTVKRGDIELIKADDDLKTYHKHRTTTDSYDDDAQGDATLEGAVYSIVNRSVRAIVSPETGKVIQPGQVACHIVTDSTGKATTANSMYNASSGKYDKTNGWKIPDGWHGALPFGDYEAFEIEAPVGYMLGHWQGLDVTYYSLCTDNSGDAALEIAPGSCRKDGGTSLLVPTITDEKAKTFGFQGASNIYDKEYLNGWFYGPKNDAHTAVKRNFPNSTRKWIDDDKVLISFTTRQNAVEEDVCDVWSEDTVKRADLELDKPDDTFNTTPKSDGRNDTDKEAFVSSSVVDYAGRTDEQGDASLEDAKFAIINRSRQAVVNPFGQLIQPGHIVCFIYTDAEGHASTKLTAERIRRNRWDQKSVSRAVDGKAYAAGANIYAVQKKWHGALPYGEYEVFEVDEPEGYLNGHWFNDIQTRWAGMVVKNGESNNMTSIAGTDSFKSGFRADYPAEFARAYDGDSPNHLEWYRIYANSPHKWVEIDNFEWYKEQGYSQPRYPSQDGWKDEVQFTQDALKNGSSHKSSLDSHVSNPNVKKEQRFENTVMRGDIDLYKADDSFKDSRGNTEPEGNGTIEKAIFQIVNRSEHPVVSPVNGYEISPGDIVCWVVTDKKGFASTKLSPERIAINGWDADGGCFAYKNGWHGALAYGEYEVYESDEPVGYLLNHWFYDAQTNWCGMAVKLNHRNKYYQLNGNTEIYPNSATKWIDHDKSLVTFTSDDHWFENTPERGDIELYKADDTLNTSPTNGVTDTKGRTDEQGDATLAGAVFKIVNRSEHPVVSPENGREVDPGDVVCTIITDENGFASTKLTEERMAINRWQEPGNPNSHSYAQQHGWHYALPYGEYEVYEHQAPGGYLVGHWFNNEQTKYAGMAIAKSNKGIKRTLFGNCELYPSVTRNGWADDDVKSWINDEGVLVEFTNDEQWFEDTVERGDLDLYKADDTLNTNPTLGETDIKGRTKPQGNATLKGAVFKILNRSDHVVVSPVDGREVQPGDLICTIITDENGYASTALTADRLAINKWASDCYAVQHGWHGALAYGEYEAYECEPPEGYLLNHWKNDVVNDWAGMAIKDDNKGVKEHQSGNTEIYPSSTYKWVNRDKALVSFIADGSWFENTVKRGDLDLQKVDSNLVRTEHGGNVEDRQGRATLEGAVFGIYNRSKTVVVSPQTGEEVWPTGEIEPVTNKVSDGLVCTIVTDKDGFASTKLSEERVAINKWDPDCIGMHEGWHGALAYGEYEVIEMTPPEGYLLNKTWHGMAVKYNTDGSATQNPRATTKDFGDAKPEAFKPNSLDEKATWIYEDKVLVSFGSTVEMIPSRDHINQSSWVADDVIRGGVRVGKVDRQNQQYKPQGAATFTGIKMGVYSTNPHPVVVKNHDGSYTEHAKWLGADGNPTGATLVPSGDMAVATTKAADVQTEDGVLVKVIDVKLIEENGEVKYVASTNDDPTAVTDDSLPYGTYRLKELYVPDNCGYLFDMVSKSWEEDFAIGSNFDKAPFTTDPTYHTTVTIPDACKIPTSENQHAWFVDLTNDPKYCAANYVIRADVDWKKIAEDSVGQSNLSWVPFLVTSLSTGESHIVVTDFEGHVYTANNERFADYENKYTYHSYQTNGNDYMLVKNANGIPVLPTTAGGSLEDLRTLMQLDPLTGCIVDESGETPDFYPEYGTWFNGRADAMTMFPRETRQDQLYSDDLVKIEVDDSVGALPYDNYVIHELLVPERVVVDTITGESLTVPSNADYYMIDFNQFSIKETNVEHISRTSGDHTTAPVLDLGTFINKPKPSVGTTFLTNDGIHMVKEQPNLTVTDHVVCTNINVGTEYTVKGQIHLVGYESDGTTKVDEGFLSDENGRRITAETSFVADSTEKVVELPFTFDASLLAGREIVAFETLFVNDTEEVASHENIADTDQTIAFPKMGTTLTGNDGRKEVSAVGTVTLTDVISYENLVPGAGYSAYGTLQVRDANGNVSPAKDKYGNEITAEKSFAVTDVRGNGTVTVTFIFDAPHLAGCDLVAFEELYYEGKWFLEHKDKDDVAQTIYMPAIHTDATDAVTNTHYGLADGNVTIDDEVAYERLSPGHKYTMIGKLMDKETGFPLKDTEGHEITSSLTFIPNSTQAFNIAALKDKLAEMGYDLEGDGDKGVFNFDSVKPGDIIDLPAIDGVDAFPGYDLKLSFGDDYRIVVYAQNKIDESDKVEKIVIEAMTVEGDTQGMYDKDGLVYGEVTMRFTVPGDVLADKVIVVYEQLYADLGVEYNTGEGTVDDIEKPVAVHEDISDEAQSVTYPSVRTTATDAGTGEHYGLAYDKVQIEDVVAYTKLRKGSEYRVSGTLYDKETGNPVIDESTGTEITAFTTFIADDGNEMTANGVRVDGSVKVVFECLADAVRGKRVVVFEDLYENGKKIGFHADIDDEGQMVEYPEIGTMAQFGNGEKSGIASRETLLTDIIYYENLRPGVQYKATGVIHFKGVDMFGNVYDDGIALDPDGNPITAEAFFTPDAPVGQVSVMFNCNATTLQFRDAVVFEQLFVVSDISGLDTEVPEDVLIAVHEDIADEGQTVSFRESDVAEDLIMQPQASPVPMTNTGDDVAKILVIAIVSTVIVLAAGGVRRLRNCRK